MSTIGPPRQTIAMTFREASVWPPTMLASTNIPGAGLSIALGDRLVGRSGNDKARRIEKLRASGSACPCIKNHMAAAVTSAAG